MSNISLHAAGIIGFKVLENHVRYELTGLRYGPTLEYISNIKNTNRRTQSKSDIQNTQYLILSFKKLTFVSTESIVIDLSIPAHTPIS